MIGRFITRAVYPTVKNMKMNARPMMIRPFGTTPTEPVSKPTTPPPSDVVIPELYDTLEWTLSSPPPVHQFIEQPIIVEIDHLENLKPEEVEY